MRDTIVIGVDPGGCTGIAVMKFTDNSVELEDTYEWTDQDTAWLALRQLADHWVSEGYEVIFAVEQFDKRPGIVSPDYSAKFVERDIDNNLTEYEIKKQIPAQAKNFVKQGSRGKPDQLKRFGWYQVAHKHARDAIRHCIVYGVETLKHRPLIDLGWPRDKEEYQ